MPISYLSKLRHEPEKFRPFPFLVPKIYRETSTVKFSFKHKENVFMVTWYLVCQPLGVSATPLKRDFPTSLPVDVKETRAEAPDFCRSNNWAMFEFLGKIAREIKICINRMYLKQLLCFKPLILNARQEARWCIRVTAVSWSLWA